MANTTPTISDASRIYYNTPYKLEYHQYTTAVKNLSFKQILEASNYPVVNRPEENDGKYVIAISRSDNLPLPYDMDGVIYYLSIPYQLNHKVDVYLVDENNNLVTFDRHNDDKQTDNTLRKKVRAFYTRSSIDEFGNFVAAPKITKIIIVPRYGGLYGDYPFAYETFTTYKTNKLDEQLQYPVTDVRYSTNRFTFKTDFESNRFICTQVAYDDGWTVVAKDSSGEVKNLPIYKTQGGFVGFVSLEGETNYEMVYKTPYLTEGAILTIVGLVMYLATTISFYYISYKQTKREQ